MLLREPADKSGVAALTGSLLEEGTDKHTGKEIAALDRGYGRHARVSASRGGIAQGPDPRHRPRRSGCCSSAS